MLLHLLKYQASACGVIPLWNVWGLPTVGTGATRSRETAETRGMRGKVM